MTAPAPAAVAAQPLSIDTERCDGCGWCAIICPIDVLRVEAEKAYAAYPSDCQICFTCVEECHADAITLIPRMSARVPVSIYDVDIRTLGPGHPFPEEI